MTSNIYVNINTGIITLQSFIISAICLYDIYNQLNICELIKLKSKSELKKLGNFTVEKGVLKSKNPIKKERLLIRKECKIRENSPIFQSLEMSSKIYLNDKLVKINKSASVEYDFHYNKFVFKPSSINGTVEYYYSVLLNNKNRNVVVDNNDKSIVCISNNNKFTRNFMINKILTRSGTFLRIYIDTIGIIGGILCFYYLYKK